MKHQINTIREALEFFECGSYSTSKALTAITALSELEAMVGEQEPCGWFESPYGAFRGNPLLNITFPASTLTWQIPAFIAAPPAQQTVTNDEQATAYMNARLWEFIDMAGMWPKAKPDPRIWAHVMVYATPAQQPQYEAGDMASAHNDGFRAGVASVAQQPHEIEVQCPVCNHKFHDWPGERKAQQPQAEKRCEYCDGTGDVHTPTGEWRGECHCQKQPQAEGVPAAMKVLLDAMRSDPDYAWGWYRNVAMAFVDAGGDPYIANQGAARFMRLLANVEPAHELPEAPQQAEAVPPGFVLVPLEPDEMWAYRVIRHHQPNLDAGCKAWLECLKEMLHWHAAIAAQGEKP